MRHSLLLLLALLAAGVCPAQSLIPFLGANGQYGFANPAGKVVTPPQFKKAWRTNEQGLTLATDAGDLLRVIRQDGVVLPAAVSFRSYSEPVAVPAINFLDDAITQYDTLQGLWCIRSVDSREFLLVKNGKSGWESRQYLSYDQLKSSVSIYGNYRPENYSNGPFTFYKGLHRVIKGEHRVNFVNTRLEELFKTDYENGTILSNGSIALANTNGRFALADPKGNILTGFQFRHLIGTPRKEYCVINYAPGGHARTRVGLLRTDGSLAIDTVYEELRGLNADWVLASRDAKYGVLDYAGRVLLPLEYLSLEYARGSYFIASKEGLGQTIIDISGTTKLDKSWPEIHYHDSSNPNRPAYFELSQNRYDNRYTGILDTNLRQVFADSFRIVPMNDRRFQAIGAKNSLKGVVDYSGTSIVPALYQSIEPLQAPESKSPDILGYIVAKDSLFGFYTYDGRLVLPCRYTRLVPERNGGTLILWGNTQRGKNQFSPFTLEGERLPFADQIMPTMQAITLQDCFAVEMENGQWKLILPDGSWVYKSREYSQKIINVRTPGGCLLVEKEGGKCQVLNAHLKSILPKGFSLPEKLYRGPYLQMGLIPVYNQTQCGIINTRGEWVKKPAEFGYHILRPNIYSEHKGQPAEHNPQGATIYTITPEGGTQSLEVQYLNDKFRDGYLVIGRQFEDAPQALKMQSYDGKVTKYAIMDTMGQVLTPFALARYPEKVASRWLASVYNADYSTHQVLFDDRGRQIRDFGTERVVYYDPERHWVYYDTPEGLSGIRDTLGREILPLQYRDIQWPLPGKLFSSSLSDGKRQLCALNGKCLLSGIRYVNRCRELPGGYFLVQTEDRCYVFAPDYQQRCSALCREAEPDPADPDLLILKTEAGGTLYVNYKKGVVYGE
ncbi:MAG: WG repeat-containing protein [Saprospiraceae bacterium]|nr:WG repeat-containing protein [Saprospiraceae bacterium]